MALLEVVDLRKRFGGLQAVSGVSLDVAAGEIVGLIGPNGAGKTTLFHLISGFLAPDAGECGSTARPPAGLRPHEVCRRGLARTFQIVKPFPGLTVLENVRVGALARTRPFGAATGKARGSSPSWVSRTGPTGPPVASRSRIASASSSRAPWRPSRGSCCSTR